MRQCKRQGCNVILLTAEKLRAADWPRESLDDTFYLPEEIPLADIVNAVTHLARTRKLDRIVALDEFDMETAATLREHLRGAGDGTDHHALFPRQAGHAHEGAGSRGACTGFRASSES